METDWIRNLLEGFSKRSTCGLGMSESDPICAYWAGFAPGCIAMHPFLKSFPNTNRDTPPRGIWLKTVSCWRKVENIVRKRKNPINQHNMNLQPSHYEACALPLSYNHIWAQISQGTIRAQQPKNCHVQLGLFVNSYILKSCIKCFMVSDTECTKDNRPPVAKLVTLLFLSELRFIWFKPFSTAALQENLSLDGAPSACGWQHWSQI